MSMTKEQEEFCKQLLAQNITREMPEFTQIYEHVKPIVAPIQDALDYGHQIAVDVLKKKRKNKQAKTVPDQWVHSQVVRWAAQTYLLDKGIRTKYSEDAEGMPSLGLEVLPINGLAGEYDGRKYRILKGRNGQLPVLGLSSVKKGFYRQLHILKPYLLPDNGNIPKKYNVVFLWDISPKNYVQLYLSCPRYWMSNRAYDYFTKLLAHPVEVIITNAVEPAIADDGRIPELKIERIEEFQGKLQI